MIYRTNIVTKYSWVTAKDKIFGSNNDTTYIYDVVPLDFVKSTYNFVGTKTYSSITSLFSLKIQKKIHTKLLI